MTNIETLIESRKNTPLAICERETNKPREIRNDYSFIIIFTKVHPYYSDGSMDCWKNKYFASENKWIISNSIYYSNYQQNKETYTSTLLVEWKYISIQETYKY